jgi:hypothetical protein
VNRLSELLAKKHYSSNRFLKQSFRLTYHRHNFINFKHLMAVQSQFQEKALTHLPLYYRSSRWIGGTPERKTGARDVAAN